MSHFCAVKCDGQIGAPAYMPYCLQFLTAILSSHDQSEVDRPIPPPCFEHRPWQTEIARYGYFASFCCFGAFFLLVICGVPRFFFVGVPRGACVVHSLKKTGIMFLHTYYSVKCIDGIRGDKH
jgi:hypothetical protein